MSTKGDSENIKKIMLNKLNQTLKKNDTESLKKSAKNKYLCKKGLSNNSTQNQSKILKSSQNDSIAK